MIEIVEVGLRDGLQNEPTIVPTHDKVRLAGRLVGAGLRRLEVASFVHPKLVPAMADAEAVLAGVPRRDGVRYAGLVLNARGLDRALAAGVDEVNVVVCASDTFSVRNQNATTQESLTTAVEVTERARAAGVFATVTVATAFGCPFEGEVPARRVLEIAERALRAGADEICLADTVGVGVPAQVAELADAANELRGGAGLRFHFHNTRNTGFANAWTAVRHGATALDASAGGIGGCPFAPRATGNIGTDDLTYLLERCGVDTGLDLQRLVDISDELSGLLGRQVPSLLPRAGGFPSGARSGA
jgi:hydroxymethylglutaryl-CoA lyase